MVLIEFLRLKNIKAILLFFIIFFVNLSNVQAANDSICRVYATAFLKKPNNLDCLIKKDSSWSKFDTFDLYMKKCSSLTDNVAKEKLRSHVLKVRACDNEYKYIIFDPYYSIMDYSIGNKKKLEMKLENSRIKKFIFNSKNNSPYTRIYPDVIKLIENSGNTTNCNFRTLSVELDNRSSTKEWVVVSEKSCLPKKGSSHIWIIQKLESGFKIVFEDESPSLLIQLSTINNFKTIRTSTSFLPKETTGQRCGGLHVTWYFEKGRYIPLRASPNEGGGCLPYYSAQSDQVDIADYPNLLDQEMKERKKLYEPYVKAITDYIPHWKKRRTSLTRIGDDILNNGSFNKSEEDAIKKLLNFQ